MSEAAVDHVNEVHLVGKVSDAPIERIMPSGDLLLTWMLVVNRTGTGTGRASIDTIECATFLARVRRSAANWGPGDVVEVEGSLRRRFFTRPGAGGKVSRYQVDVAAARRLDRAPR